MRGLDCSNAAVGRRMAELRGDRPQVQFVVDLHRVTGHRLSQSMLSRKENGGEITMCDIAAVAMMDREARGREWLAFGCWEDRTTLSESGTPGRGASSGGD